LRSFLYFNNQNSDLLKSLIIGVVSAVTIIAILMCILCVVFLATPLPPHNYLQYIMLAIDAIAVYFGSYIAARINKSKGLIVGISVGAIILISLIASGFMVQNGTITITTLLKAIIILIFSALGGIKGVNIKEKIRIK